MTNVERLPATAVPEGAITAEPLSEIAVGDLVVTYSRGTDRLAEVTKVGPKRIEVIYTTKGAWDEAARIAGMYLTGGYAEGRERYERDAAGDTYDYYKSEGDAATAKHSVASKIRTEETAAAERAKYRATSRARRARSTSSGRAARLGRRPRSTSPTPASTVSPGTSTARRRAASGRTSTG
jgi:hypothetical protein